MLKKTSFVVAFCISTNTYSQPSFIDRAYIPKTNIMCMDDRCYSPNLGIFLTRDPKKQSFSEYSYGEGNPIKISDPSGDMGLSSIIEAIVGVIMAIGGMIATFFAGPAGVEIEVDAAFLETAVFTESTVSMAVGSIITDSVTSDIVDGVTSAVSETIIDSIEDSDQILAELGTKLDSTALDGEGSLDNAMGLSKESEDEGVFGDGMDNEDIDNENMDTNTQVKDPHGIDNVDDNTDIDTDTDNLDKTKSESDEGYSSDDEGYNSDDEEDDDSEKPESWFDKLKGFATGTGKDMVMFGGIGYVPQVIGDMEPSPAPKPKPQPKPQ